MVIEVALDLAAFHERLGRCRRDQERVRAGRSFERQPGACHVAGELAAREATSGVRDPVVGAVEALHAWLPEAQHAARSHDARQLAYDDGRVGDRTVAQDRHAHDRVERAGGERQTPGVGGHEPDRFVAFAEQGECFPFEVDGDEVTPIREPPARRAGAASHVEEPAAGPGRAGQQLLQQRPSRAIPPVHILDLGHPPILGELHDSPRPPHS